MTKFAVFEKGRGFNDFSELAAQLFNIKGRRAAETAKKAGAALLEANPHLRDLNKVSDGTLIVIPDLPDNPPLRGSQTSLETESEKELKLAMQALEDMLGRSTDSEEQAVAAINEALKNRDLQDFAGRSEVENAKLKHVGDVAKNRLKEAKANAAAEKDALDQLQEELKKLTR